MPGSAPGAGGSIPSVRNHKFLGKGVCPQSSAASSVISMTDFQSVITAIQNQVSVSTVVGVLATLAGIGVGFAFMWWGIRKAQRVIMGSAKSGKLRI